MDRHLTLVLAFFLTETKQRFFKKVVCEEKPNKHVNVHVFRRNISSLHLLTEEVKATFSKEKNCNCCNISSYEAELSPTKEQSTTKLGN